MKHDLVRAVIVLGLAVGQIVVSLGLFAVTGGFKEVEARDPWWLNPTTPAGYAFVIWAPVFLASVVFGACQLAPSARRHPAMRTMAWWAGAGYVLCALWAVWARLGPLWATVPTIAGMTIALAGALVVTVRRGRSLPASARATALVAHGLYAGWLTAATFANTGDVLGAYGGSRLGLSVDAFGVALALGATAVALALTVASRASMPYVLAVLWALTSVAARNAEAGSGPVLVASLAGSAAVAALAIAVRVRHAATPPAVPRGDGAKAVPGDTMA